MLYIIHCLLKQLCTKY